MPTGYGSSASNAVFSEYSNISIHFICSNCSLPLLSTLHLSEENPLVLHITLLGFSNWKTERETREHLPFLLQQMLPERPLAAGRSSCTRNHPQPLQNQVQVTTPPTCFQGITSTFLAGVEVAKELRQGVLDTTKRSSEIIINSIAFCLGSKGTSKQCSQCSQKT